MPFREISPKFEIILGVFGMLGTPGNKKGTPILGNFRMWACVNWPTTYQLGYNPNINEIIKQAIWGINNYDLAKTHEKNLHHDHQNSSSNQKKLSGRTQPPQLLSPENTSLGPSPLGRQTSPWARHCGRFSRFSGALFEENPGSCGQICRDQYFYCADMWCDMKSSSQ